MTGLCHVHRSYPHQRGYDQVAIIVAHCSGGGLESLRGSRPFDGWADGDFAYGQLVLGRSRAADQSNSAAFFINDLDQIWYDLLARVGRRLFAQPVCVSAVELVLNW